MEKQLKWFIALFLMLSINVQIYCHPFTEPYSNKCLPIQLLNGDHEIECPIVNIKISDASTNYASNSTNRKIQLNINCHFGMKPENYSLLPNKSYGDIYEVSFDKCPLPLGTPIVNIIKRFGIPKVARFQFIADSDEMLLPIHFRELSDIKRMILNNLIFSESSDELFKNLTNLQWMRLINTNANNIPKDIFKPLINLSILELGGSKLKLIPGMFANQHNLINLNLWSNGLKNLSSSVFEGLENLNDLNLMSNQLETFDADSFSLLKKLTNINLSSNFLKSLPENLFSHNHLLVNIKIHSNRVELTELPNGLFSNLPNLENISLKSDEIKKIPASLFTNSTNIRSLEIVANKIDILPEGIFDDLINLKTLDLHDNLLSKLDTKIFVNNENLEVLDLSYNRLGNLSISCFKGLRNLKILHLNNNQLTSFQAETMEPLQNLQEIYLQNNNLNFIVEKPLFMGSPLNKLLNIEIIDLHNNSITIIYPDWSTSFLKLKTLDLSYNKLTMLKSIDLQFSRPNLKLNFSNNYISTIDLKNIIEEPNSIIEIDVNNNPLECNCDIVTFNNLIKKSEGSKKLDNHLVFKYDNLTCIDMPRNWPYHISGKNVGKIEPKELVCPQVNSCPENCSCWFRGFDRSVIINCTNMGLRDVPTLFDATAKEIQWIELHIENNQIQELPTIRDIGYDKVEELYAQNNNISDLSPDSIPNGLRQLNLANNQLENLNKTVLNIINNTKSLNNISISGNPWGCHCKDKDFLLFVQTKRNIISDMHSLTCASGKEISILTYNDFCYSDIKLIITLCVIFLLLAILIAIAITLYYKYQLEFKLWLFDHNINICIGRLPDEELDKNKKYDAFISYSHKDENFVSDELIPNLESEPYPFKLCIHVRDFIPGEWIHNQIHKSVEESRRTIIVLSKNFLESEWGQVEFRTAHSASLTEGRTRLIIIIYDDIGDIEKLDPILKAYLKMNTYVKWGDPWFWKKLRYAMPHPDGKILKKTKGLCKTAIKSSVDDRLELIKPVSVTPPIATTPPANSTYFNSFKENINTNLLNCKLTTSDNGLNQSITSNGLIIDSQKINSFLDQKSQFDDGAFIINTNSKQSDV